MHGVAMYRPICRWGKPAEVVGTACAAMTAAGSQVGTGPSFVVKILAIINNKPACC